MNRRNALKIIGGAGTTAVAGCVGAPGTGTGRPRTQQVRLTVDDGGSDADFGNALDVSGDGSTLLVGAPNATTQAEDGTGAGYVFERTDGSWSRAATLTPDDRAEFGGFGSDVALSRGGSIAVVGCPADAYTDSLVSGGAYVFERSDGEWTHDTRLDVAHERPSGEGQHFDAFGSAVAVSDDSSTILVGAPQHVGTMEGLVGTAALLGGSSPANVVASPRSTLTRVPGAAFLFERSGGEWSHEATFGPADGDGRIRMGSSVALAAGGSMAFVCANAHNTVSVFERADGFWTAMSELPLADGIDVPLRGAIGVSSDGTTTIVGDSPGEDDGGSATVFDQTDGSWVQSDRLSLDHTDAFGPSVAMSGDGTVALVPGLTENTADEASVYVFTRTDDAWTQRGPLSATDTPRRNQYGESLSLSGDGSTAAVGAPRAATADGRARGAVYVFE